MEPFEWFALWLSNFMFMGAAVIICILKVAITGCAGLCAAACVYYLVKEWLFKK